MGRVVIVISLLLIFRYLIMFLVFEKIFKYDCFTNLGEPVVPEVDINNIKSSAIAISIFTFLSNKEYALNFRIDLYILSFLFFFPSWYGECGGVKWCSLSLFPELVP